MRFLGPQLLAQHTDRVYRAAWALCGSPEEAEALVLETFRRVSHRPRLLHGEASDLTHLMCALHNSFLTSRRDAALRPLPGGALRETDPADSRSSPERQKAREVRELYAAIAGLPEHLRLTLVAIDVIGLSCREASRSLGVSQGNLSTRLFRARRLVTQEFAERAKPRDPTCDRPVTVGRMGATPFSLTPLV
jgi:RNA polymerase sigma-70 factor, ECF subfamily